MSLSKVCVVTGVTSGIGFQIALQLASEQRLLLIVRNPDKGERTKAQILQKAPGAQIDVVLADLSNQQQIKAAAATIQQLTSSIDTLINNAGIWHSHRSTKNGIEEVFAVNHLSYFLLTHLLLPLLANSPSGRVINISSDSHFNGRMHFDDLQLEQKYHGLRSYAQSKLANVLFTYEFDRRNPRQHITINAVQPGLVKTDIGIKHTSWLHALAWRMRRMAGMSAAEAAQTALYLATSPEVDGISAKYWESCQPKASSKASYDLHDARKLWEVSQELCGVEDYFFTGQ